MYVRRRAVLRAPNAPWLTWSPLAITRFLLLSRLGTFRHPSAGGDGLLAGRGDYAVFVDAAVDRRPGHAERAGRADLVA